MAIHTLAALGIIDWAVLGSYLVVVIVIGLAVAKRRATGDDFFLAGRRMPAWAVAISVLATSQSAATFVGGPQQAYAGDLTYFAANLGALIAVLLVAWLFLPAYYRHDVTSVYELIGLRCGRSAQAAASGMFMTGRVFASGARLFIVALPFALITFGDVEPSSLTAALIIIAIAATIYTMAGGIRAVIWTDVIQAFVYVATIVIALAWLWPRLGVSPGELIDALDAAGESEKLRMLDTGAGSAPLLSRSYSIWAILIGLTLFNLAAFGADQDLAQRMLTCKSARSAGWSVILSNLIGWPIVLLFLLMGLLLFVYYQRPEIVGITGPDYAIDDSRKVFLEFILNEMPTGLRGLMLAGLFAAAMSSMDSALNAMASTTIADFVRPLRRRLGRPDDSARELRLSRIAIVAWAVALAAFATGCIHWQRASGDTLIDFALGVMVYAYAGLLGVFLTLIVAKRGSGASVLAALAIGFLAVFALGFGHEPGWVAERRIVFTAAAGAVIVVGSVATIVAAAFRFDRSPVVIAVATAIVAVVAIYGLDLGDGLAFPWRMTAATGLAFGVCVAGAKRTDRADG